MCKLYGLSCIQEGSYTLHDLELSQWLNLITFSQATSHATPGQKPTLLMTEAEVVSETLGFCPVLTWLVAWDDYWSYTCWKKTDASNKLPQCLGWRKTRRGLHKIGAVMYGDKKVTHLKLWTPYSQCCMCFDFHIERGRVWKWGPNVCWAILCPTKFRCNPRGS